MIAPSGDISSFHRAVEKRTADILGYDTLVEPVTPSWESLGDERQAVFRLVSRATGITGFAHRVVGGWCPVLPMSREEAASLQATVWAGWQEDWVSLGARRFELIGGAWTFFWGHQTSIQQLFRADWDNIRRRRGRTAQPHWHFDKELMAEVYRRPVPADIERLAQQANGGQAEDRDLVELSIPNALQDVSLAGLHLGMGGWTNPGTDHECWQQTANTLRDLKLWACSALQYAKAQFGNLKHGEPVSA